MAGIPPFSIHPPRLVADATYNEHVVRGLKRIRPDMYIITAHAVGLANASDVEILTYAARQDLILLTHDVRTMPGHFAEFLTSLREGGE